MAKKQKQYTPKEMDAMTLLGKLYLTKEEQREALKKNPLELLLNIENAPYTALDLNLPVSFGTVDRYALEMGGDPEDATRVNLLIRKAIVNVISKDGHTIAEQKVAHEEYVKLFSYPLDYHGAKANLKDFDPQRPIKAIKNGKLTFRINSAKLKSEFEAWDKKSSYDRAPFCFSCLIPDDPEISFAKRVRMRHIVSVEKDGKSYYQLSRHYDQETKSAKILNKILRADKETFPEYKVRKALDQVLQKMSKKAGSEIVLEPEQENAILNICRTPHGVCILTGPAGSGKTFVLKIVIGVLGKLRKANGFDQVVPQILAPTGKAAQVAAQATGLRNAATIHRYFQIGSESNFVKVDNTNLFIVDEFSMVDTSVLYQMLERAKGTFKMVFVGDTEQLPSVGAGSCLRDLIASERIPHYRLLTAKRQAQGSGVLINANKIIAGEPIKTEAPNAGVQNNAYHQTVSNEAEAVEKIKALILNAGLERFQAEQVQILCPTKKGTVGTHAINFLAQSLLNPKCEGDLTVRSVDLHEGKVLEFRVGDKVINTKNNYELETCKLLVRGEIKFLKPIEVMNGETGVVEDIVRTIDEDGKDELKILVRFSKDLVCYEKSHQHELSLAYAITIHKSQGSQWPVIISPFVNSWGDFYSRQLLYTMYTRAQSSCFVISKPSAINHCVNTPTINKRQTMFQETLRAQPKQRKKAIS